MIRAGAIRAKPIVLTGLAAVLGIGGPWMLRQITGFTTRLFENVPYLIG